MLNVIDDLSRECLASVVDTSISGKRVVRELATIVERRDKPLTIVAAIAILAWCEETGIEWHYIAPAAYVSRPNPEQPWTAPNSSVA